MNDYSSGSMEMILESMKVYPIKCIKYNNTLEDSVQSNYSFDSFLTVSNDGTKLIISNKKPTASANEYILDADPTTIEAKQNNYKNKQVIYENKVLREIRHAK